MLLVENHMGDGVVAIMRNGEIMLPCCARFCFLWKCSKVGFTAFFVSYADLLPSPNFNTQSFYGCLLAGKNTSQPLNVCALQFFFTEYILEKMLFVFSKDFFKPWQENNICSNFKNHSNYERGTSCRRKNPRTSKKRMRIRAGV